MWANDIVYQCPMAQSIHKFGCTPTVFIFEINDWARVTQSQMCPAFFVVDPALTAEPTYTNESFLINWTDSFLIITKNHAYSNILKILPPKNEKKNQIKNPDIFLISAQNIDCGYLLEPPRWGGSNEYPQSMSLSRNEKNNGYLCKPQFYYIKVGFNRVKII